MRGEENQTPFLCRKANVDKFTLMCYHLYPKNMPDMTTLKSTFSFLPQYDTPHSFTTSHTQNHSITAAVGLVIVLTVNLTRQSA